jgi:hypothetical protein
MRMDRLPSHADKQTQAYLKDCGTNSEFVGPGMASHYQAGSLEIVMYPNNRRIVAAMQYANAPRMMWGDAWLHVVNTISNLTKRPCDSQTPYEMWNYATKNELTSFVDGLRILFCLCFPHFSTETRKKLDLRSGPGFKAYRVLMIRTGKIVAAAEATFNESIMPFHYPEVWRTLGFDHFRAYDDPVEYDNGVEFDDLVGSCTAEMEPTEEIDVLAENLQVPSYTFTSHLFGSPESEDNNDCDDDVEDKCNLDYGSHPVFRGVQNDFDHHGDPIDRPSIHFTQHDNVDAIFKFRKYAKKVADGALPGANDSDHQPESPDNTDNDDDSGDNSQYLVIRVGPKPTFRIAADDNYPTAHLHIGWRSQHSNKPVWTFEPMADMEHLEIVQKAQKTAKFKKTLAALKLSIAKQHNAYEDAKSSVAFMNNSEEYHAKPDSPPETEYVVMLPNNLDLDQLQEFAKLPNLTELHSATPATALSSITDYSDAVDVKSMAEAAKTPYEKEWTAARDAELSSLKSNGVMIPVTYEPWMAPLVDSKLVFKVKRHPDNTHDKFKVRWVARGFSETFGRHFNEMYSPVASHNLLRLLLSIFASRPDVTVYQADVKTAFLHPRRLKEQIFMKPMKFMGLANGQVFKLLKTIYYR